MGYTWCYGNESFDLNIVSLPAEQEASVVRW